MLYDFVVQVKTSSLGELVMWKTFETAEQAHDYAFTVEQSGYYPLLSQDVDASVFAPISHLKSL